MVSLFHGCVGPPRGYAPNDSQKSFKPRNAFITHVAARGPAMHVRARRLARAAYTYRHVCIPVDVLMRLLLISAELWSALWPPRQYCCPLLLRVISLPSLFLLIHTSPVLG